MLDLEGDGSGCRSGRGVAREGSRGAPERGEQRSASGEREGWSHGEGDEAERVVESREREEQRWRVWDKPCLEGDGHMGRLVG